MPTTAARMTIAAVVCAIFGVLPGAAGGATGKTCRPVVNPYTGTRYAGVNLSHIRARGVSCRTARRVARGAHRKALGVLPSATGIRRFTWHRWRVTGDLRPASDIYVATRGTSRVRWRF